MRVRSGLLAAASCALISFGAGIPVASADESTCAAIDQMSKAVDDPANNGPIVTEALMYLRADNPAYSGLDRQVEAISQARDMWGRVNDGVRGNLDGVTEPGAREQLTAYADGLSGAYDLAGAWLAATPEVRSSPEIIDRGAAVGGLLFDGVNNFHVLANICDGGRALGVRLDPAEARHRFRAAAVARLATVDASGRPHLVPVTFAVADDIVCWAVDHKPKSRNDLQRVRNIAANPTVSFLVDHYDEDWSALWWVRADGVARVLEAPDATWISLLANKYRQYRETPPSGPMVLTEITGWSGWTASRSTRA